MSNYHLQAIQVTGINPILDRAYAYDAAGNRIAGTAEDSSEQAYTYNQANRMSGASVDAAPAASYTYNPLGQRIIKTLPNNKEIYHYDESGLLIAVTNESNATLREYVYLDGQAIAFITNGQIHYIHNDHLGTPQVATDQNQQVVWMGDYQPFGKLAANQSNSIELYSRFPGQYFDEETGLYYNYFRDYDPSIGRYIQSDPIGLEGGINTYVYVEGNPLRYVDPEGLAPLCPPGQRAVPAEGFRAQFPKVFKCEAYYSPKDRREESLDTLVEFAGCVLLGEFQTKVEAEVAKEAAKRTGKRVVVAAVKKAAQVMTGPVGFVYTLYDCGNEDDCGVNE